MVLGFRFLWSQFCCLFKSKVPIHGPVSRTFTILPFLDAEFGFSLNAARYFVLSEIVQQECNTRSGITLNGFKNKVWAITLSNTIFYKKAVRAFSRLTITVELIGWDDRFWVWQNLFRNSRGEICAVSFTKVAGRSARGLEPTATCFKILGQEPYIRGFKTDLTDMFKNLEAVAKRTLSEN